MTARTLLLGLPLGAALLIAAPTALRAQSSDPTYPATGASTALSASKDEGVLPVTKAAPVVPATGPRVESSIAGVRLQVTDAPLSPAPVVASRTGRGQALAIVGGVAFLGGLMIGDNAGTAIAVGGLGVGVYGLWLWLGGK
jgi:hypothetical protein